MANGDFTKWTAFKAHVVLAEQLGLSGQATGFAAMANDCETLGKRLTAASQKVSATAAAEA